MLQDHTRTFHGYIKIKCHKCEKEFSNKKSLAYHIKTLHGDIKYKCDKCYKEFNALKNLKTHWKNFHSDLENISWTEIPKSTTQNIAKSNSIDKSSICNRCGITFHSRNSMLLHCKNVHVACKKKALEFLDIVFKITKSYAFISLFNPS